MKSTDLFWPAFWLAVAVYMACECVLTLHGIDTFFWEFKTPAEKQVQQKIAGGCK